jgi:hypothetical protein
MVCETQITHAIFPFFFVKKVEKKGKKLKKIMFI